MIIFNIIIIIIHAEIRRNYFAQYLCVIDSARIESIYSGCSMFLIHSYVSHWHC